MNNRWEPDELEYLDQLSQGDKGGYLTWDIIAKRINDIFGNNRTPESCRLKRYRFYKKILSRKIIVEKPCTHCNGTGRVRVYLPSKGENNGSNK